jgi:hypothetical protein
MFLFCPETTYKRADELNLDLGTVNHIQEKSVEEIALELHEVKSEGSTMTRVLTNNVVNEPAWTFAQELRLWRGIESDDNMLKVILRPFPLLLYPQVMYAFVSYGLSTAWLIVLIGVQALVFGGPPYLMSVSEIGLLGIAGLIASIFGFMAGPINDAICKAMARRNNGIYEPEVPAFNEF